MKPLAVIQDSKTASVLLQGERATLLHYLKEPLSATALAKQVDLPRQKVNYHLRALEEVGLVEMVEERKARNCIERVMQATATSYLISPEVLQDLGGDAETVRDRFSAGYLLRLAGRTIREVGAWQQESAKIPTFSLDADLHFDGPESANAFAEALTNAVAHVIKEHNQVDNPKARPFRFQVGIYPARDKNQDPGTPDKP